MTQRMFITCDGTACGELLHVSYTDVGERSAGWVLVTVASVDPVIHGLSADGVHLCPKCVRRFNDAMRDVVRPREDAPPPPTGPIGPGGPSSRTVVQLPRRRP